MATAVPVYREVTPAAVILGIFQGIILTASFVYIGLKLGFGLTGYLLPWDLKAYFGTKVATEIPGSIPVVGPYLLQLIRGGEEVSPFTLTRFYSVHVIILPALLAVLLGMESKGYPVLVGALLLGTPTLSLIGAVGAALILGARRGGVLLSLLVLPLFIPTLIFGVSAVDAALTGFAYKGQFFVLGAFLLASLALAPWAAAAAVRQALE